MGATSAMSGAQGVRSTIALIDAQQLARDAAVHPS